MALGCEKTFAKRISSSKGKVPRCVNWLQITLTIHKHFHLPFSIKNKNATIIFPSIKDINKNKITIFSCIRNKNKTIFIKNKPRWKPLSMNSCKIPNYLTLMILWENIRLKLSTYPLQVNVPTRLNLWIYGSTNITRPWEIIVQPLVYKRSA